MELNDKQDILQKVDYKETPEQVFSKERQVEEYYKCKPFFYNRSGLWWIWNVERFCWEQTDEIDILNSLETKADINSPRERSTILNALKQQGRKNIPPSIKPTLIQFQDTIYDVETGDTFLASSEFFVTNPIPWKISEFSDTPTMDEIFRDWVGEAYVDTLYEIIAYSLIPDYPLSRIFCFIGSGSNGKSCFLNLLAKFLGEMNCCSTELDVLLSSRFEMAKLHKKLICIMGETNMSEMRKTAILKSLTGSDTVSFEWKNKTPFNGKNYAKILIATNNLPTTPDKTDGFYRRWLIIDFPNRFTEKKDILATIPDQEYNNLATKCVFILNRLLKEREFTNEGSVEERMKRFEDKANPLQKFWEEEVTENYSGFIFKYEFRDSLKDWLISHKYRQVSDKEIAKFLKDKGAYDTRKPAEFYEAERTNKQYYAWGGISWKG